MALLIAIGLTAVSYVRFFRLEQQEQLVENATIARSIAAFIEAKEAGHVNVLAAYAGRFRFREAIRRKDEPEALGHLRQLHEAFPVLGRPFLADKEGVLWATYPRAPQLHGRSFADREWYQGVSRDWRPYVSEVTISRRDGEAVVVIALPIHDVDGRVIGIMGAAQPLDVIRSWLEPIHIPNGDMYVVDQKGRLVFHRLKSGVGHLDDYVDLAVVRRLLAGEEGVAETETPHEQQVWLSAYRRLPSLGWGLVVRREKNAALLRARTVLTVSAGAGLMLIVVMAWLGLTAVRHRRQLSQALSALEERSRALQEARDEADRASRAKSEFLSRMSHELRTPLNSTMGFAQLLQTSSLSADDQESVEHILKGGTHLLGLINEVLDLTRIESGRLALSPEPVELLDAVRAAVALVQPLASQRRITLAMEPDGIAGRHVMADRQRLQQILLNLLANAVKYNRDGGEVRLSYEAPASGRLRVLVHDTGPGISPASLSRLFNPFDRLGAEQTGVEGTGLGLALSRRLAETMGGSLDLVSHVGVGSTFWVELPETESPLAKHDGASELATEVDLDRSRGVLLYIEDNVQNVRLLERILARRPGVRLLSAMQGSLGLELAQQHLPDLILLDLNLPDLPGPQVLARLRAHPRTRDIPVAILSADATPGEIRRMLADGAISYMTKPLDVMKLLELVDEILTPA
jgi:signal transduction histidine kinase/CheY-like chemotaxis protein